MISTLNTSQIKIEIDFGEYGAIVKCKFKSAPSSFWNTFWFMDVAAFRAGVRNALFRDAYPHEVTAFNEANQINEMHERVLL